MEDETPPDKTSKRVNSLGGTVRQFIVGHANGLAVLVAFVDVFLFLLVFYSVTLVSDYFLIGYNLAPPNPSLLSAINELLTFSYYTIGAIFVVAAVFAFTFNNLHDNPKITLIHIRVTHRWARLTYGAIAVILILVIVHNSQVVNYITSPVATIIGDIAIGALFPFLGWMVLYFFSYFAERTDPIYGNIAYLRVLGGLSSDNSLAAPRTLRFILLGSYRVILRALTRNIQGLHSADLERIFSKIELAVSTGSKRHRVLISRFARKVHRVLDNPDPRSIAAGKVIQAIDELDKGLPDMKDMLTTVSFSISWPKSLRQRAPAYAGSIRILIEFIVSLVAVVLTILKI